MSRSKAGRETAALPRWAPKLIVAEAPQPESPPEEVTSPDSAMAVSPASAPVPVPAVALPQRPPEPPSEPVVQEPDPELLDQARAAGYALGIAEGRRQVAQQAAAETLALQSVLQGLGNLRAELETGLADEVLTLAVSMARQIVRESFALRPAAIVPVLRDALQVLPALNQQTVLHLHPEDAALVKPLLDQDTVLAQTTWRVVEDVRMERGGCRLETLESEVDATLPARWSRVLAALGREENWQLDKPG